MGRPNTKVVVQAAPQGPCAGRLAVYEQCTATRDICACHRVLGGQPEDHEWDSVARLVLDYVGLSDYDFVCLKESIRELGVG